MSSEDLPRLYTYKEPREHAEQFYRLETIRHRDHVIWIIYDLFIWGEVRSDGTKDGAYGYHLFHRRVFVGQSSHPLTSQESAITLAKINVDLRTHHDSM